MPQEAEINKLGTARLQSQTIHCQGSDPSRKPVSRAGRSDPMEIDGHISHSSQREADQGKHGLWDIAPVSINILKAHLVTNMSSRSTVLKSNLSHSQSVSQTGGVDHPQAWGSIQLLISAGIHQG